MAWHVNSTVKLVIAIFGNITALGLFTAPIATFTRIWRKRSTEEFSPLPYICTLLNCSLWTLYGLPFVTEGNILVSTVNGVGVILEASYLIIFFAFALPHIRLRASKYLAAVVALFGIILAVTLAALHGHSNRGRVVGVVSDVVTIFMYASPLVAMRLVIVTRSVEFMPFFLSFNAFANGVVWSVYAIYVRDIYLLIPNSVGALLGAGQLVLYGCYHNASPVYPGAETSDVEKAGGASDPPKKVEGGDAVIAMKGHAPPEGEAQGLAEPSVEVLDSVKH
eukprot:jgi/Mesen1/4357/ME000022S03646